MKRIRLPVWLIVILVLGGILLFNLLSPGPSNYIKVGLINGARIDESTRVRIWISEVTSLGVETSYDGVLVEVQFFPIPENGKCKPFTTGRIESSGVVVEPRFFEVCNPVWPVGIWIRQLSTP